MKGTHIRVRKEILWLVLSVTLTFGIVMTFPSEWGLNTLHQVRLKLDRAPPIHPGLKIYAFGDIAVQKLQATDLPTREWLDFFAFLKDHGQAPVLVDKIFSMPDLRNLPEQKKAFFYSGSFTQQTAVVNRSAIQKFPDGLEIDESGAYSGYLSRISSAFHYGPHPKLQPYIVGVGSIDIKNSLLVKPLQRLSDRIFLRHLGLQAANSVHPTSAGIVVNGRELKIDANGEIPVDLIDPGDFYRRTVDIGKPIKRMRAGLQPLKMTNPEAVVVLPAYFTGNTDMIDTPFGRHPGGLVLASVVNSVLQDTWLTHVSQAWALVLCWTALGFLAARWLDGWVFLPIIIIGVLLPFAFAIWLFVDFEMVLPWVRQSAGFVLAALPTFSVVSGMRVLRHRQLAGCFSGLVPKPLFQQLAKGNLSLLRKARKREMTIMFVDMVGLSRVVETLDPSATFDLLQKNFDTMTRIIHKHGGIIDKTLGDGLLAFFGYHFETSPAVQQEHGLSALNCANEIQRTIIDSFIADGVKSHFLPLRIGLETSTVDVGNLGNASRIDLTLIGTGVNYAKRLESACEPFRVLCGRNICANLSEDHRKQLQKRYIRIKHEKQLHYGWESDLFLSQEERKFVNDVKDKKQGFDQVESRTDAIPGLELVCGYTSTSMQVLDLSFSGFLVESSEYFAPGVILSLEVVSVFPELEELLEKFRLKSISAEVRWGYPDGKAFRHGLMILSQNVQQHKIFAELLEKWHAGRAPKPA